MYILPFLVVLLSLTLVKKNSHKPFCIIAGILCTLICNVSVNETILFQNIIALNQISKNVLKNNISLFMTLLLFGILIELITSSGSIDKLTNYFKDFIYTKKQFIILFFAIALFASVDDYLACLLLITILGTCYNSFNLLKEELCFYINTIVVAFCSILPISTWAPVILESLNVENNLYSLRILRYCFNYFTFFSVFVVCMIFKFKKVPVKKYISKPKQKNIVNFEVYILLIAVLILYLTYTILKLCPISIFSNNALLISCVFTTLFCLISFLKNGNIHHTEIKTICIDGLNSMWDLVKFLYLLWIYTDCLNQILEINGFISAQVTKFNFSSNLLPFIIYILSGFISYCTGSIFATIRLLVPISITLGTTMNLNNTLLWLIASAALNGSLLASLSPLSDTLALCSKKINISSTEAYSWHIPYSFIIILASAIAYLISGYTLKYSILCSIIIPLLVLSPLVVLYLGYIDKLKYKQTLKTLLVNYINCYIKKTNKLKWEFVKRTKNFKTIIKKYTTKPICIQSLYHFKLC